MPPAFFVTLPFFLLLLLLKGTNPRSTQPTKPTKSPIGTVIDLLNDQEDEIIIVRKKTY